MATHSTILAWRIPRTKEPGGLQSWGSQRVGRDWVSKHASFKGQCSRLNTESQWARRGSHSHPPLPGYPAPHPICAINSGMVHEDKFLQRKSLAPGVISRVKSSQGEQSFFPGDYHFLWGFDKNGKLSLHTKELPIWESQYLDEILLACILTIWIFRCTFPTLF